MLITKSHAKRLMRQGKARPVGRTTDQPRWCDRHNGQTYVVLDRLDLHRVDHYRE